MVRFLRFIQHFKHRERKDYKENDKKSYQKSEGDSDIVYIIAGLGNPDKQYEKTRHNIGFDTIDALAEAYQVTMHEKRFRSVCGSGVVAGQKTLFLKPQTYMNNSGEAIGEALRYYKLDPASQLLVIYDDISLDPGSLRIRLKGSAGGHNGIKSIIAHVGTEKFARIKIGVGKKPADWDLVDHVLGRFSQEDRAKVESAVQDAVRAAELILAGEQAQAMNLYNSRQTPQKENLIG